MLRHTADAKAPKPALHDPHLHPGQSLRSGVVIRLRMPQLSFHTPLGALTLSEEDGAIVALDWGFGRDQSATPLLIEGRIQLQAYFDGVTKTFTLPLSPTGTPYQQRVWAALAEIPYGQTCSYAAIAAKVGGSARAVGSANGANPIPIVIPCHRVVGSTGLGGYSGGDGLKTKRWLLALEQGQPHCAAGLED